MPTIVMLNQKGGVGKTSTTYHLGGALAKRGRRVLLVDNDPQSSLTQGVLGSAETRALDPGETIAAMYRGDAVLAEQVVRETPYPGLSLLPGSRLSASANRPDPHLAPWSEQAALIEPLAELRAAHDIILVDCPPNLHLCSWAALAAADAVLVPLQAEAYGAQGLEDVLESIEAVRRSVNPALRPLGFLFTMFNPRVAIHQLFAARMAATYGPLVFETTVPLSVDMREATAILKPVAFYKPKGATAKALDRLADEFLRRLDAPGTLAEVA